MSKLFNRRGKVWNFLTFFCVFVDHEKAPYPPAYSDVYPVIPAAENSQMGWNAPTADVVVMPSQPPPVYVTQPIGKR